MPADERFRQIELAAERAHFVLEQFAQRLDELHVHALRQAADIVMRLDRHRRPAGERHAFDHVRIERALRQKIGRTFSVTCDFLGLALEHVDEQFADGLALFLRIVDAFERLEEKILGGDMHQRNVVVAAKQSDDALAFTEPQQPVIDEDASELIADRLVDENGGDRGIDAAGQAADHPALPDLPADFVDRFVLECPHRPIAGAAGDVAHEVAQDGGAVRRVDDFKMELRGVEPALLVGDHCDRRIGRGADGHEALRAAALPGRHGSSIPDSVGRPPTRLHRGPKAA